ncbi:uncharacterized protein LOC116221505 [Clupea harengus]|uniref:Uncharacterized protein LOC116221505 n=1 Tax=Clupea harengus TaxID=7950 RepID=A0A8M1KQ08_CLUHA|nr:uncharacterized protein LOC116221505 [Clupea harengus]
MMDESNQNPQCYCYKCPIHQTGLPDEGLRMRTTHSSDNRTRQAVSENSQPEYLLEEICRPEEVEGLQAKRCGNRLVERLEGCPKPSAGQYRLTLGGVKHHPQHRRGGPSSDSSSPNSKSQMSEAAKTGGLHSPSKINDDFQFSKQKKDDYRSPQNLKREHKQTQTGSTTGIQGRDSTDADRPASTFLDVACQTNIRKVKSTRGYRPGYPGTGRERKASTAVNYTNTSNHLKETDDEVNYTNTSNHLKETDDKNACRHEGSCVRRLAVFTLAVGAIGFLAMNHQKYLNRQ